MENPLLSGLLKLLVYLLVLPGPTDSVAVTVTIENIKTQKGTIEVGVYDDPSVFLDETKGVASASQKVTGKTMTFKMRLPKEGKYALAIYHDENADKIFNKNFLGIPKEPYGFSKIRKAVYSKPTFNQCSLDTRTQTTIRIKLLN